MQRSAPGRERHPVPTRCRASRVRDRRVRGLATALRNRIQPERVQHSFNAWPAQQLHPEPGRQRGRESRGLARRFRAAERDRSREVLPRTEHLRPRRDGVLLVDARSRCRPRLRNGLPPGSVDGRDQGVHRRSQSIWDRHQRDGGAEQLRVPVFGPTRFGPSTSEGMVRGGRRDRRPGPPRLRGPDPGGVRLGPGRAPGWWTAWRSARSGGRNSG